MCQWTKNIYDFLLHVNYMPQNLFGWFLVMAKGEEDGKGRGNTKRRR